MKQLNLTLLCTSMLSTLAIGCNQHPLKSSDYDNWGDDGIEDAGVDESSDGGGDDEGASADGGDDDGFPSDDDGDSGDVPMDCGGDTVMLASSPANVMLVIDKSGSMHSNRRSPICRHRRRA